LFGANSVNIVSAVVGRQANGVEGDEEPLAAMIVTTDASVPDALVQEIVTSDGFVAGVSVTL
jgi:hypothetical protein